MIIWSHFVATLLLSLLPIDSTEGEEVWLSKEVQPCLSRSIEESLTDSQRESFDCSALPSEIQTFLALQLTFCHLNSTGINPTQICSITRTNFNHQQCLKNLTLNPFAYLTYTNFLPHIQSLCYSIETQRWHHQTRDTIHQLHRHTDQIESEAKQLLIEQENIQQRLDQTLMINQHSVDDALNIDRFLQVAQSDVDDLRGHLYVKDKAQIELIHQVNCIEPHQNDGQIPLDLRYFIQHSIDTFQRCFWIKFLFILRFSIDFHPSLNHSGTHE